MTYADVFIQILHEVTGKSKQELSAAIKIIKTVEPGRLDEKLSDEKAKTLLSSLRQEKEGILAWYVKACMDAHLESVEPVGSA